MSWPPTTTEPHAADRLVERLMRAQDLSLADARDVATTIFAGPSDLRDAAMLWAETGELPDAPTVEGTSPRDLAGRLEPSQVFTALSLLRANPTLGRDVLAHSADSMREGHLDRTGLLLIDSEPRRRRLTTWRFRGPLVLVFLVAIAATTVGALADSLVGVVAGVAAAIGALAAKRVRSRGD
jgi:hypothetical protein